MLYSHKQVEALLKRAKQEDARKRTPTDEHAMLLRLEAEVRKAFHPATEDTFNGQEVDHLLTRLDILRAERATKPIEDEDDDT